MADPSSFLRDQEAPRKERESSSFLTTPEGGAKEFSFKTPFEDALAILRFFRQQVQDLPTDTPLTEKLFAAGSPMMPAFGGGFTEISRPAFNIAARLAPAAAGFIGWRAGGPTGAVLVNAGMSRGASALLGLATEGAIGGAAAGAAQAGIEQEPVLPNTAAGLLLGAGLGAGIGKLSGAGNRLVAEYAKRAGPPLSLSEIAAQTPNLAAKRLELLKGRSAARAFRALVPEGGTREGVGEVLWERARAAARAGARQIVEFEIDPTPLSNLMHNLWRRSLRPARHEHLARNMDSFKKVFGTWVTRMAITLRRDALSFPDNVGHEAAAAFERIPDLIQAYEGKLLMRMEAMLRGVPKHEISERVFDFIAGQSKAPLSVEGTAAAQAWRSLSDDMFGALESRGVRELVPPTHPAGQTELLPDIAQQARIAQALDPEKGGWQTIPLQYRRNYVPFYRDAAAAGRLRRAGPERNAAIDKLLDNGQAASRGEADALLTQMLEDSDRGIPLEIRGGVAQHAREALLGLPVIKDARVWMRRSIHEHARRAAEAEVLGGQDQKYLEWIQRLKDANGDTRRFDGFFRLAVHRPWPSQVKYAPLVRGVGDVMNMMYLGPKVGVLQFMQLSNTAARLGWRSVLEGITTTIRSFEARQMVREAGATLPSFQLQTGEIDAMGRAGRWWMEWITHMPKMDRAVRIVSGIAGGIESQRLAQRMLTAQGISARTIARRLEYLGLDPEQVIRQGGKLEREQILAAMRNASNRTQFASTALDMPEAWRTDAGKLIFKLRTFAKQQTTFVDGLVNDAMRGDVAPLARYLLTYPTVYMVMRPYLDFLSSRPAIENADAEVMEAISNALYGATWSGMFGGLGDFINNTLSSDVGRMAGIPLGVAGSTLAGTAADVGALVGKGNARPLVRRAMRTPLALPVHMYEKIEELLTQ